MEKSKNAYYNAIASENLRISLGKDKNMLKTAVFGQPAPVRPDRS